MVFLNRCSTVSCTPAVACQANIPGTYSLIPYRGYSFWIESCSTPGSWTTFTLLSFCDTASPPPTGWVFWFPAGRPNVPHLATIMTGCTLKRAVGGSMSCVPTCEATSTQAHQEGGGGMSRRYFPGAPKPVLRNEPHDAGFFYFLFFFTFLGCIQHC